MGTPQLNIKDAVTSKLVRELAEITGDTQTEAVRKAVKQRLEHVKAEREEQTSRKVATKQRELKKVHVEIRKIQKYVRERGLAANMLTDEDLYDQNGLPK
jgi:antitoxin VapB